MSSSWTIDPTQALAYGEMILDGNGTPTTCPDPNKPVASEDWAASHLNAFTVVSSKNGVITDTESNGGVLRITDATHGLVDGDIVTITNLATPAQNGITAITKITNDIFDCDDISWVTDAETGTWEMGSYLLVPAGHSGDYLILLHASATAAGVGKVFLVQLYVDTTAQADAKTERKYTAADIGAIGFMAILPLATGERLWIAVTNLTDGTDITIKHGNLSVHRI